METIKVNIWGWQTLAILTTWKEIKGRGFEVKDAMFGQLNDGRLASFFNGAHSGKNGGSGTWYVTTGRLEDIHD